MVWRFCNILIFSCFSLILEFGTIFLSIKEKEVMMLTIKENEVLLIYDSDEINDKEARVYVHSFKNHKVKDMDINRESLTEQQFAELSRRLGVHPSELLDKQSEFYKNHMEGTELSKDDIFKMLKNNPKLLKTPIIVYHDRAEIVGSQYNLIKDDMATKDISLGNYKQEESG